MREELRWKKYPKPPFETQHQSMPGIMEKMSPKPDHEEATYKGSGKLKGLRALSHEGQLLHSLALFACLKRSGRQAESGAKRIH